MEVIRVGPLVRRQPQGAAVHGRVRRVVSGILAPRRHGGRHHAPLYSSARCWPSPPCSQWSSCSRSSAGRCRCCTSGRCSPTRSSGKGLRLFTDIGTLPRSHVLIAAVLGAVAHVVAFLAFELGPLSVLAVGGIVGGLGTWLLLTAGRIDPTPGRCPSAGTTGTTRRTCGRSTSTAGRACDSYRVGPVVVLWPSYARRSSGARPRLLTVPPWVADDAAPVFEAAIDVLAPERKREANPTVAARARGLRARNVRRRGRALVAPCRSRRVPGVVRRLRRRVRLSLPGCGVAGTVTAQTEPSSAVSWIKPARRSQNPSSYFVAESMVGRAFVSLTTARSSVTKWVDAEVVDTEDVGGLSRPGPATRRRDALRRGAAVDVVLPLAVGDRVFGQATLDSPHDVAVDDHRPDVAGVGEELLDQERPVRRRPVVVDQVEVVDDAEKRVQVVGLGDARPRVVELGLTTTGSSNCR